MNIDLELIKRLFEKEQEGGIHSVSEVLRAFVERLF